MSDSLSVPESLLLLFERPYEPVFFPKGPKRVVLRPPPELLSERNRELVGQLGDRFGAAPTVALAGLASAAQLPPALTAGRELPREVPFSVFVPWHRQLAADLIQLFLDAKDASELRSLAAASRECCNPQLFVYALSVALLHRADTRGLRPPPLLHVMPAKFVPESSLGQAFQEASLDSQKRRVITIPRDWTASDAEPEHRLAYFREDIGINMHHWHWHLVYPFTGPRQTVDKDRRGEMFYYMHQQIIARYNLERFSVGLARVRRLVDFRAPMPEGYFPKLHDEIAQWNYAGRPDNISLSDIRRDLERMYIDIKDLERWESRLYDAIHTGSFWNDEGDRILLTEEGGIDVLGNLVEASDLSPNRIFYGDLHNSLHYVIGASHDPIWKHREMFQALADPVTSMRDPVFYAMHAFIDDLLRGHKHTLPPYSAQQLGLPGVQLRGLAVQSAAPPGEGKPAPGVFRTFLQESEVDLSRGLDFAPSGPILVRFQHLQHAPYSFSVQVENSGKAARRVTVRVFLAPESDERGTPLLFRDHKNFFVEIDKFVATVPPGTSTVQRRSEQSSVTVPWEQTFRDVDTNRPPEGTPELEQFVYCGCGWPQHMLLPRGNAAGLPCVLFAMLTDYELDKVEGSGPGDLEGAPAAEGRCKGSVSFCGLRNRLFPDRRPMGFPFDRLPRNDTHLLRDFMAGLTNMQVVPVKVQFTDRVLLQRGRDDAAPRPVT